MKVLYHELTLKAAEKNKKNEFLFLQQFYKSGELVFDVGANNGSKALLLAKGGAHIICFEPQPECIATLQANFFQHPNVIIVQKGIADTPGTLKLSICSEASTISTFSEEWKKGRFADYTWDSTIDVEVITLEDAIKEYGTPVYIKIDVEGFEMEVLKGLKTSVPFVSFEFTVENTNRTQQCLEHLQSIGYRWFNVTIGESAYLSFDTWISAD